MGQIEFKTRLIAPCFTEIPEEISDKWVSGSKKAAKKTYKGLKKAVKTKKDFDEKIGEPAKKTIASFINPEWTSKHGLTYDDIMNKTRESLDGAGKRYFRARKDVYETGQYEENLEFGQKEYARKWCKYLGPLRGYKAGNILGLATMAVMALTGKSDLLNYLRGQKVKLEGQPLVISTPDKLNKFRRKLDSRIVHWGSEIITQGYEVEVITRANEELNRLVNEYLLKGIASFSPNGISYMDFIVEEIPDPARPGMRIKQLGLDICVTMG